MSQERTVLPLVRDWTQQGLLSPSVWVSPRDISIESGPPRVEATLIANGGGATLIERRVDLFEVLARDQIERVRLIKLRSPSPDKDADSLQDEVSAKVGQYVALSLPQANPTASGAVETVDFIRATLICAPTGVSLDDRLSSLEREAGVIVVASPEDRAAPSAGDAFVRDDERFAGFVLMNLATIGGLWNGLPMGSLELFDRESSAAQSIWIQRAFVRGVVSRGLAGRAAVGVLERILDGRGSLVADGVTITPTGTTLIPEHQARQYVDLLVDSAMSADERALDFRSPALMPQPSRRAFTITQQLVQFSKFAWGKFARIPHWIRLWSHDRVATKLTAELQGDDGYRQITLQLDQKPDSFDKRLLMATERLTTLGALRSKTVVPGETEQVAPRLWPSLRRLIFAAVDGSPSQDLQFGQVNGNVPVFRDLSLISPDPKSIWTRPDATRHRPQTITWAEYCADPDIRELLVEQVEKDGTKVATLVTEELDAQEAAEQDRVELDEREEVLIGAGALRRRADGRLNPIKAPKGAGDGTRDERDRELNLWRELVARSRVSTKEFTDATGRLEIAREALEISKAALASFDEWRESQASTFTLLLQKRMADAQATARSQLAAEDEPFEPPAAREIVRLRRAFHRSLLVTGSVVFVVVVALVLILIGVGASLTDDTGPQAGGNEVWNRILSNCLIVALIGFAVFVVLAQVLVIIYYRGWSNFARKIQLAEHRAESSIVRLGELRREVSRLESIHRQAEDWVDLLTTAIYDPWSIPPEWGTAEDEYLDASRLPFAMSISSAVNDQGLEDRLRRDAASELLRPGWRDRVFRFLLEESAHRAGVVPSSVSVEALDADVPSSPNRARQLLRHHMSTDEVLSSVAQRVLLDLADHLQDSFESSHAVKVQAFDRGGALSDFRSDGTDPLWNEFLMEPLTKAPHQVTPLSVLGISSPHVQRAHHEDVTSYVLCSEAVAEDVEALRRESVVTHGVVKQASDTFDALVRVDVAGPVPLEAIHAISRRTEKAAETTPTSSGRTSSGV